MHFSNQDKNSQKAAPKKQNQICSKCGFENYHAAHYCEICFYPLNLDKYPADNSVLIKPKTNTNLVRVEPKNRLSHLSHKLRKPNAVSGLLVLGLAIALWFGYLLDRRQPYLSLNGEDEIALYDSMSQVRDVPNGLFSYGGALYFASLVAHGINEAIAEEHPDFNLRYTKSNSQDYSPTYGIKMLLDGELSFAFNDRPLTQQEYLAAELRNLKLLQIPIAIDGIAVFSNEELGVTNLDLEEVQDLFSGKITNWQELGGPDLPVVPVLLTPENLGILGIKDFDDAPPTTQYVDNYTLAIRKTIATPGAISLASTSLVQNQQRIRMFNLAEEDSIEYVAPMINQKPNLKLFGDGTYPLTRRLFVVIRQDGTPDQIAGKAYAQMLLSHQGQKIVKASGFVPLYNQRI